MDNPELILTNTHSFKQFRTENCIYVDKTRFAYELIKNKMTQCFLSRPRRFGKSLFLNMLKELFSGNKKLFEGLYIYDKYDFKSYPVIHLTFTMLEYDIHLDPDIALSNALKKYLGRIAKKNQIPEPDGPHLGNMIDDLYCKTKKQVVLLIDEYDKPLLSYINEPDARKKVLKTLKNFFSPLKDLTDEIKFLFITGVSKFSQVSIFSDLNNLDDLTMNPNYSTIAGYTQKEMEFYFKDYIPKLAERYDETIDEILSQIKSWYDGYSWDGKNFVYAPFSISNLLKHSDFSNSCFKDELVEQNDTIKTQNYPEISFTEKILVLYSKQDESFKDKLIMHLQPIRRFGIACYDDITFDEIQLAESVSKTKNINLLLSPQFLASDLFQSTALDGLAESYRQKRIQLFPIVVQPCSYKTIPWLVDIGINSEPLATLSQLKQDEILADIVVKNARKLSANEDETNLEDVNI